ncbi:MAG: phage holin family protein [Prevotellaceae bacterium]|nr:phage holin family protein [Prevotellaceae bacterium]
MFASDKHIDNLQQLFIEFKKYLELQKEYTKLELTEKLSVLLSTLVLVLLLIILSMVAMFYLSLSFAYVLSPLVGGLTASYGIIAACYFLLILLIAVFRRRLIIQPTVRFLAELFLKTDKQ